MFESSMIMKDTPEAQSQDAGAPSAHPWRRAFVASQGRMSERPVSWRSLLLSPVEPRVIGDAEQRRAQNARCGPCRRTAKELVLGRLPKRPRLAIF